MVDEDGDTASARCPSHRHRDSISSLPDEILQHILSYLPTKLAITTSVLSKQWRHVWFHTPSLSFSRVPPISINKALALYKAHKMTSFHLSSNIKFTSSHIDGWIKLVMSKKFENISLDLGLVSFHAYYIPDFFYINSSVKQISVELDGFSYLRRPCCSVSWPSLKKLSLYRCELSPEFIDIISSGCPILESLTLHLLNHLKILDLSKSQLLRILDISSSFLYPGPMQILAPQVRCLRLKKTKFPCTLDDVSSLVEATLDINFFNGERGIKLKGNCLEGLILLKKLNNVEKLSFGANFLKILSLAELLSLPFPSFKVKDLTLETMVSKYVVPGLERVLQKSTELKKLTLHITDYDTLMEQPVDKFLDLRAARRLRKGYVDNICWSSEARVFENISYQNLETKHLASFMELMLKNTKTLEKMVVRLEGYTEGREFDELREMVSMLSHSNNVHIVVSSTEPNQRV